MTWNFCPWCGHRLYQHDGEGCTHTDQVTRDCEVPDCAKKPWTVPVNKAPLGGGHAHWELIPCDCTRAHPFLAEAAG
jgi:hypothetical protein